MAPRKSSSSISSSFATSGPAYTSLFRKISFSLTKTFSSASASHESITSHSSYSSRELQVTSITPRPHQVSKITNDRYQKYNHYIPPLLFTYSHRHVTACIHIQAFWRRYRRRAHTKLMHQRKQVAEEVFSTEMSFISSLNNLIQTLLDLPPQERLRHHDTISRTQTNLSDISTISLNLVMKIRLRLKSWDRYQTVSDLFNAKTWDITGYMGFITHHQHLLNLYRDWSSRDVVSYSMSSWMIFVVQRLVQYIMMLQSLQKLTPVSYPDHKALSHSIASLRYSLDLINAQLKFQNPQLVVVKSKIVQCI